jgi:peptidoglycan/xylan/chitin deacetylase (PgdA/CDA1 family)
MNQMTWPNGSRIAVALSVMLETWPEGQWPHKTPGAFVPRPGVADHQAITWSQYGGKSGVWRILRILEECGVPATFCVNARAAEVYPHATAQIVRSGHDIAAHGYTQDQVLADMKPDEEHATIRRCVDMLEQSTGKRPQGWLSPILAWTEHTDDILAQEKLLWHGDANYTDLPRRVHTRHGPIAHIPHSDYTDNRVMWLSPIDHYNVYKETFDYLYEREPMSLLVLCVHSHFGGRPLMSAMLDKLLRYFAQHSGVWFARHGELARWALDGKTDGVTNAERFFGNKIGN